MTGVSGCLLKTPKLHLYERIRIIKSIRIDKGKRFILFFRILYKSIGLIDYSCFYAPVLTLVNIINHTTLVFLHEKRVILFRELVLMMTLRYLNTLNQRQSKPGLPFQVPDFPPVNISAVGE